MWYNLILFCLSTTGFAWVFTKSKLLKPVREAVTVKNKVANSIELKNYLIWYTYELLRCVFCTSIWTGILMYLVIYQFDMSWVAYPFVGALVARVFEKLITE